MEHGISLNRRHLGSDDIGYALSPMSDSAEGATNGISATLIGRVWMRGFDGGAVVAVRRRRPTAGCSRVKQWSQKE